MNCAAAQRAILEAVDDPAGAPAAGDWTTHAAGCPACRAFAAAQRQWDEELRAVLRAPELPADFLGRLLARLPPQEEAEIAAKRRQYLQEYDAWVRATRFGAYLKAFRPAPFVLGYGSAAVAIVVGANYLLDQAPGVLRGWGMAPTGTAPLVVAAALAAALCGMGMLAGRHALRVER